MREGRKQHFRKGGRGASFPSRGDRTQNPQAGQALELERGGDVMRGPMSVIVHELVQRRAKQRDEQAETHSLNPRK